MYPDVACIVAPLSIRVPPSSTLIHDFPGLLVSNVTFSFNVSVPPFFTVNMLSEPELMVFPFVAVTVTFPLISAGLKPLHDV